MDDEVLAPGGVPTENSTNQIFGLSNLTGDADNNTVFAQVGANVANMMLLIAGIVIVTVILYSGLKMILAQGDEEKIQAAKKQLINSLLAIVVIMLVLTIAQFAINLIARPVNLDTAVPI